MVTKTTHGKSRKRRQSRLYGVWRAMINRCHNPKQINYPRYGGRGVRVCKEWRESFMAFYLYIGDPPRDGQRWTLDRIDVFSGYEPGNVRWATYKQQNQLENKRPKIDVRDVEAAMEKHGHGELWKEIIKKLP